MPGCEEDITAFRQQHLLWAAGAFGDQVVALATNGLRGRGT